MAAARSRKRKTRSSAKAGEGVGDTDEHDVEEKVDETAEDACKECGKKDIEDEDADKTQWIACGACKRWFHWKCTPSSVETASVDAVDKWSVCLLHAVGSVTSRVGSGSASRAATQILRGRSHSRAHLASLHVKRKILQPMPVCLKD